MLTQVSQSSQSTSSTAKQICLQGIASILYTVPAGKTFKGYIYPTGGGTGMYGVYINGVQANINSSAWTAVEFLAGTTFGASGQTVGIMGIEQ